MRFASPIPRTDTRLTAEQALEHPTFLQTVMALWDEKLNTAEIAKRMWERECVVAFCVRMGREQRRETKAWE